MSTGSKPGGMNDQNFKVFSAEIEAQAKESAKYSGRGTPNIEDISELLMK